jgi:hypothetical protein
MDSLHYYFSLLMTKELEMLSDNYNLFKRSEFLHLMSLIGCRYLDNACWADTCEKRLKDLERKCQIDGLPTLKNIHLYDSEINWRKDGSKSSDVHVYGISIFDEIIKKQKQNQKNLIINSNN